MDMKTYAAFGEPTNVPGGQNPLTSVWHTYMLHRGGSHCAGYRRSRRQGRLPPSGRCTGCQSARSARSLHAASMKKT
eukprot:3499971-Pleurochrysis_carterae.AAC.1